MGNWVEILEMVESLRRCLNCMEGKKRSESQYYYSVNSIDWCSACVKPSGQVKSNSGMKLSVFYLIISLKYERSQVATVVVIFAEGYGGRLVPNGQCQNSVLH